MLSWEAPWTEPDTLRGPASLPQWPSHSIYGRPGNLSLQLSGRMAFVNRNRTGARLLLGFRGASSYTAGSACKRAAEDPACPHKPGLVS